MTDRMGFVKKVFGIVTAQLIFTSFMVAMPFISTNFLNMMEMAAPLIIIPVITIFVTYLILVCKRDVARQVPVNYYLLGAFTFSQAILVAYSCILFEAESVFISAFMTMGTVAGLTVYAWNTNDDFTYLRGGLAMLISSLIMLVIMCAFFVTGPFTSILLPFMFVVIFGMYIVIDMQLILGNKVYELNDEDYILAALILYIDIISLFLEFLKIFGKRD